MLRQLSIRNFVLIDRLDLEFEPGLIALTGETGAGKSIVLDALGLALGARADSAAVRQGERQAEITVEFALDADHPARSWLTEQGEADSEQIILRRLIDAQGRSRAQINGRPATASELRELGSLLIELHAQHEQQALLSAATQRAWLDRYAGALEEARAVRQAYQGWREAEAALVRAREQAHSVTRERERLLERLELLRELRPSVTEWTELSAEQSRLSHARELIQAVEASHAALEDEDGLGERLSRVGHALAQAERFDPKLGEARQLIEAAGLQLAEAGSALRSYRARLELDPERLAAVEARLSSLFAAARRLRVRPEELESLWHEEEAKLSALEAGQDIERLEQQAEVARQNLAQAAARLSDKRCKAAQALAEAVQAGLPDLALEHAEFRVHLSPLASIESHGAEAIEFQFRSHTSLAFAPLARVASGGELARLALAILVAIGDRGAVPTLIFDEVDVGVGGRVAAQVGRRLQSLAQGRQVLTVTHMPQVAAHADHHLKVLRDNSSSPTTRISELHAKARVEEIARMLGGHEVTAVTEKLARELLASSQRRAVSDGASPLAWPCSS